MNHGMCSVDELQVGIIDASAQVVSYLVVRREGNPGQFRVAARIGLGEEKGDLLPVGLADRLTPLNVDRQSFMA